MRRGFKLLLATVVVAGVVAGVASAGVTQNDVNQTIPWSDFPIPCANGGAGEDVSGTYPARTIPSPTTVNGNNVSGKYHFQPQGSDLTGSVTGDGYKATGVLQGGRSKAVSRTASSRQPTCANNYRLIGHGPGNNLLIHEVDHITVNANGDVTVTFETRSPHSK